MIQFRGIYYHLLIHFVTDEPSTLSSKNNNNNNVIIKPYYLQYNPVHFTYIFLIIQLLRGNTKYLCWSVWEIFGELLVHVTTQFTLILFIDFLTRMRKTIAYLPGDWSRPIFYLLRSCSALTSKYLLQIRSYFDPPAFFLNKNSFNTFKQWSFICNPILLAFQFHIERKS